ncbi:hypothetical protein EVAR_41472_1 [Eumeta japonica]|uniref:Uncharacterized protein n=1 Tax=Eumeta variegata TaxID=151549 RepID=A0A4C1WZ74_EUMVA|nr:hypothetical protein EVAR_41472_1 [Eumeta japonica]
MARRPSAINLRDKSRRPARAACAARATSLRDVPGFSNPTAPTYPLTIALFPIEGKTSRCPRGAIAAVVVDGSSTKTIGVLRNEEISWSYLASRILCWLIKSRRWTRSQSRAGEGGLAVIYSRTARATRGRGPLARARVRLGALRRESRCSH